MPFEERNTGKKSIPIADFQDCELFVVVNPTTVIPSSFVSCICGGTCLPRETLVPIEPSISSLLYTLLVHIVKGEKRIERNKFVENCVNKKRAEKRSWTDLDNKRGFPLNSFLDCILIDTIEIEASNWKLHLIKLVFGLWLMVMATNQLSLITLLSKSLPTDFKILSSFDSF